MGGWMDGAQFLVHEAYHKVCSNMYAVSLCYLSHMQFQALYTSMWATSITEEHTVSILTESVNTYCQLI